MKYTVTLLIISALFIAFEVHAQDFSDGLIGYYPFNGNAIDESPHENDALTNGVNPTTDRFGISNRAYNFDGSNDYVLISSSSSLEVSDELTFAAWIYVDNLTGVSDRALAVQGTTFDTDGNWEIFINGDGTISLRKNNPGNVDCGSQQACNANSTGGISLMTWHHVAVTFSSGSVRFYLDGNLDSFKSIETTSFNTTSDGIKLGEREFAGATNDFAGKIDDVHIYRRELSAAEIQAIATNQPPQVQGPIPDLEIEEGNVEMLDITSVFGDTDGSSLSFMATVEKSNIATLNADGNTLTVMGGNEGDTDAAVIASDGRGGFAEDRFLITIMQRANRPPTANDDAVTTQQNMPIEIDVLNNDDDFEGDALQVIEVTDPPAGLAEIINGGTGVASVRYTPLAGFTGADSFDYTINDGNGGTATATVSVMVTSNPAPSVTNPGTQASREGETIEPLQIQATDDDPLSYSAQGLPPGLSISASEGLISGTIGDGAATNSPYSVTVTVSDDVNSPVSVTFQWNVTRNNEPTIANSIPDQTLQIGGPPFTIDLNTVFGDPDGDELTFTTQVSNTSIVSAGINTVSVLTLAPQAVGSTTITVTARDPFGAPATEAFIVTVTEVTSNPAPSVTNPGTQASREGETIEPLQIQATDDDPLSYSAQGLPPGLSISASEGLISGTIGDGAATNSPYSVTVTVSDDVNSPVSVTFQWNVLPRMNHAPQVSNPPGDQTLDFPGTKQLSLSGAFSDDDDDDLTFSATPHPGSVVDASISGTTLTLTALRPGRETVTVTADDGKGGQAQTSFNVTVVFTPPASVTASVSRTFGNAEQQNNYRLVAVPGNVDFSVASTLSGSSPDDWRVFWDNGHASNYRIEHNSSATFHFRPGRGFWLLSRQPWTYNETVASVPLAADLSFAIPLHPGWNIISNPFGEDVAWSQVQAFNGISGSLWRYSGGFSQTGTLASAASGEAFYYENVTGSSQLKIPYPVPGATAPVQQGAHSALTLRAYQHHQPLTSVQVGRAEAARPGRDALDQFAPDDPFGVSGFRLVNDRLATSRGRLAVEYKPVATPGETFDLVLEAKAGEPVTLRTEGLKTFAGQAVALLDLRTGKSYDLHDRSTLTLMPVEDQTTYRLLMGNTDYVQATREATPPRSPALLANYPNPFNARTRIEYAVPEGSGGAAVRLEIFDLLGRQVRTLVEQAQESGFYAVDWDGRDDAGRPASTGVYVYRLQAGAFTQARQMVLMK